MSEAVDMRICQVCLSNGMGGAETVVRFLCRELVAQGVDVTLVTSDEIADTFRAIAGLEVISVGRFRRGEHKKCRLLHPMNAACFAGRLWRRRFDIVHTHLLQATDLLCRLRWFVRVPHVFTIHGAMGFDEFKQASAWSEDEVFRSLAHVDHFTAACHFLADVVQRAGVKNSSHCTIIPNGCDLVGSETVPTMALKGGFRALYSGGDRFLKGPDLLAISLPRIVANVPDFRLYVLRDTSPSGPLQTYVRDQGLTDKVVFVGYVDHAKYLEYMRSVDCVILPSRSEGVAASLVEALALGLPMVATSVGGTPEVIRHGENGLLCEPEPDSLADAVIALAKSKELQDRLSADALRSVKAFTWPKVTEAYVKLYQDISEQRGQTRRQALSGAR